MTDDALVATLPDPREQAVRQSANSVIQLIRIDPSERTSAQRAALKADLAGLRANIDAILGPETSQVLALLQQLLAGQVAETAALQQLLTAEASESALLQSVLTGQVSEAATLGNVVTMLTDIDRRVRAIYRHSVPRGSGVWTFHLGNQHISFTGGSPVGLSMADNFNVTFSFQALDAKGIVDPTATVAFTSDNPAAFAVVDNGDNSTGTVSAVDPGAGNLVATVTDPDGNAVTVLGSVVITAGDAAGGSFAFGTPTAQ